MIFRTLIIVVALAMAGCKSSAPAGTSASAAVNEIAAPLADAARSNRRAAQAVDGITTANVPSQRPIAAAAVADTGDDIARAQGRQAAAVPAVRKTEETSARQADEIKELKQNNPFRTVLYWFAGIAFFAAVGGAVLAAFTRNGTIALLSAVAFAASIGAATVAYYLAAIMHVLIGVFALVIICGLAVAAWMAWKWRQNHQAVVSVQQVIAQTKPDEAVKQALRIGQTPQAEAIFRTVVKPKLMQK